MNDLPMTTFGGDGKAPKLRRHNPKMFEANNVEDVEQSETNDDEPRSLTAEPPTYEEVFGIGDADTAEGQARRAEEAHLEEMRDDSDKVAEGGPIEEFADWLEAQVEDLDPLPTADEAELGELCRVPSGQFDHLDLVDDQTGDLIGVLEEDETKGATDEEVREAIEAVEDDDEGTILEEIESEFEALTGGEN